MPPGFFLFHCYSPGEDRENRAVFSCPPGTSQEPLRIPKNPACEAGESAGGITTEYSMRYPDLLS